MNRLAPLILLAALGLTGLARAETSVDLGAGLSAAAAGAVADLDRAPAFVAEPGLFSRPPARPAPALAADVSEPPNRTAIDYRLARNGLFGELGYFCLGGDPYVVPHEAAVVAGAQDGRRVGAALRYPFN